MAVAFTLSIGAPARALGVPDPWAVLYPGTPRTPALDAPARDLCDAPAPLAMPFVEARRAASRRDALRARETLLAWDPRDASTAERACVQVELARLALRQGLLPEAAAAAAAAVAELGEADSSRLASGARWLRLEALYQAGRGDELQAGYEALASVDDPRLRAAAGLRLADLRLDAGDPAAALGRYGAMLDGDSALSEQEVGPWRVRAAEAAAAAGQPIAAARWLDRALSAQLDERQWVVATLRRAALHAASGEALESEKQLADVVRLRPEGAAARLAEWIGWAQQLARDPAMAPAIADRLAASTAPPEVPRLAIYGKALDAEARLASGDALAAFDGLVPLLGDSWADSALSLADLLDRTLLAALGEPSECPQLVGRLVGREQLVLRHVSQAAPLAALGACQLELGLIDSSLAVLRAARERFGAESVALPIARASLRAGRPDIAENAARDRIASGVPDRQAWQLLLAEARLAAGDVQEAQQVLAAVATAAAPGPERSRAIVLLAEAARQGTATEATRSLLADAIEGAGEGEWQHAGAALASAALTTARLTRRSHDAEAASRLYAVAAKRLPAGERRAQALYWVGRLSAKGNQGYTAMLAAAREVGPWSDLARERLAIETLGQGLSRGSQGG